MGEVISILMQKGGCSKTTSVYNLAPALGELGKKVLAVDFDPQATLTNGFGNAGSSTIYDVMTGKTSISSAIVQIEAVPNVWLLPSHINAAALEVELAGVIGREKVLAESLAPIKDRFDFILIDSPPSLGLLTVNSLVAADSIIIPCQTEYWGGLEAMPKLMHTIETVKTRLGKTVNLRGVLLTMVDQRRRLDSEVIAQVKKHFSGHVFKTMIPRSVKLAEAPSFLKPITIYAPHSAGCEAYRQLAREVVGK